MLANALNGQFDRFRRHFQPAIDGAPQGQGLHDRKAQVMPVGLPLGDVVPAAVFALGLADHPQRTVEDFTDLGVAAGPIKLPEDKRREPVIVHRPLGLGDVQQIALGAERLGVTEDVIQPPAARSRRNGRVPGDARTTRTPACPC